MAATEMGQLTTLHLRRRKDMFKFLRKKKAVFENTTPQFEFVKDGPVPVPEDLNEILETAILRIREALTFMTPRYIKRIHPEDLPHIKAATKRLRKDDPLRFLITTKEDGGGIIEIDGKKYIEIATELLGNRVRAFIMGPNGPLDEGRSVEGQNFLEHYILSAIMVMEAHGRDPYLSQETLKEIQTAAYGVCRPRDWHFS